LSVVNLRVGAVILALIGGSIFAVQSVRRFDGDARCALIPLPRNLQLGKGNFVLTPTASIEVDKRSGAVGELLASRLRRSTGYELPVRPLQNGVVPAGAIVLTTERVPAALGAEGYGLEVNAVAATIRANGESGFVYGMQTLLQLLPPRVFSPQRVTGVKWTIPCVLIQDQPRFLWRGFMLDVSRHFFSPAEVERVLDTMALHKLNIFHWHLTDDQGWRIEIKRYPRLTEVGAWRKRIGFNLDPGATSAYNAEGRYGGYYTQSDIREIMAYARVRGITVVPEIEMPGHSSAALAAQPEFSCSGGPYTTDMNEAVAPGVYCAGKEETFQFLENILAEVMELFPGGFIHIGGDEVCRSNWRNCSRCRARMAAEGLHGEADLQTYFVERIEKFIRSRGKRLVGWSEIQHVGLGQDAVLMDWIGGGVEAARTSHDIVMAPVDYCYLDFYQSKDRSREPPAAGAYLPVEKVYEFEPIPAGLDASAQAHVLGAQGNLWTEYVPSLAQAEYMAFPRLSALAEVVWSPKDSRDWRGFQRRWLVQEQRLDAMGVRYRR